MAHMQTMREQIPQVKKILAVASGKGGVGKTTVTVNLALALAERNAQVGIFDADIHGPNVPLMLGVHRSSSSSGWLPVARAKQGAHIQPLERFGLKVMSIGLLIGERDTILPDPIMTGRIAMQTLRDVRWGPLDYLLLDLPPGSGDPQLSLVQRMAIDGAIVVTTPQDLSLLDAGRSLGMFRQHNIPILGVIENMSYAICPHCGEQIEVFHHSERSWAIRDAAVELLGRIPMDISISRAIDAGHPLLHATPDAPQAAVFRTVAAAIASKLAASDAPPAADGL